MDSFTQEQLKRLQVHLKKERLKVEQAKERLRILRQEAQSVCAEIRSYQQMIASLERIIPPVETNAKVFG